MNKLNYCIGVIALILTVSCQFDKKPNEKTLSESKLIVDTIFSHHLNENRLLSIYLPKGYQESKVYPVVYAADGQIIVESYKKKLDSLIDNKTLSEFILIGVHSNEKKVPNEMWEYRNYEYNKDWIDKTDSVFGERYINHYKFFTQEVIEHAEHKYAVSTNYEDKIFYGASNGAGLGVSIGAENPLLFKHYICLSMAGGVYEDLIWTEINQPYYYLSYGDKEPFPLTIGVKEFDEFLSKNKYKHELSTYDGGHDRNMWEKEFFTILPRILAKIKAHNIS